MEAIGRGKQNSVVYEDVPSGTAFCKSREVENLKLLKAFPRAALSSH